jgi:hypothetical protein
MVGQLAASIERRRRTLVKSSSKVLLLSWGRGWRARALTKRVAARSLAWVGNGKTESTPGVFGLAESSFTSHALRSSQARDTAKKLSRLRSEEQSYLLASHFFPLTNSIPVHSRHPVNEKRSSQATKDTTAYVFLPVCVADFSSLAHTVVTWHPDTNPSQIRCWVLRVVPQGHVK